MYYSCFSSVCFTSTGAGALLKTPIAQQMIMVIPTKYKNTFMTISLTILTIANIGPFIFQVLLKIGISVLTS